VCISPGRILIVGISDHPKGKLSTLQESRATGYLNDLPEINYDFNAPIRQYGTISDSYREIKLLEQFLNSIWSRSMAVTYGSSKLPNDK